MVAQETSTVQRGAALEQQDTHAAVNATACCGPEKQATCCEPSAKSSCCGTAQSEVQAQAGGCGCQ
jgi:hypothetical protein